MEAISGGVTVSVAVRVASVPQLAAMSCAVGADTGLVVIVNDAEVAPPGIVMLAGMLTPKTARSKSVSARSDVLLAGLLRLIVIPLAAAAPLIVTVPVELVPPATLAGLSVSEDNAGGTTVSVAVCEFSPAAAVICAVGAEVTTFGFTETGCVCTMNVADVAPLCTTTLAGTSAICGALLASFTVIGCPAAAPRVTEPLTVPPPIIDVGLIVMLFTCTTLIVVLGGTTTASSSEAMKTSMALLHHREFPKKCERYEGRYNGSWPLAVIGVVRSDFRRHPFLSNFPKSTPH